MFQVILFDLGGVLVELDKPSEATAWFDSSLSAKENWDRWLTSPHAQAFERGELSPTEFATQFIQENNLSLEANALLRKYKDWVLGFYPGVFPVLTQLKNQFTLGVFSNITEVHWPEINQELRQHDCFTHLFASYLIGYAKPEPDAFRYVAEKMAVNPADILFLDDTEINVDGARKAGMTAAVVDGFSELKSTLDRYQISV